MARLREFIRQPEAIFWSYFFPVLLVLALGLAFQSKPEQKIVVDVETGPQAASLRELLASDKTIEVHVNEADVTRLRLRTGRTALVISSADSNSASGSYAYVFDPVRPESAQARLLVDD